MSNMICNYVIISEGPTDVEFFIYLLKNNFGYKDNTCGYLRYLSNRGSNFIFVHPISKAGGGYSQLMKKETYIKARSQYKSIKSVLKRGGNLYLKVIIRSDTEHRTKSVMSNYMNSIETALRPDVWHQEIPEYDSYDIFFADRQLENRYLAGLKNNTNGYDQISKSAIQNLRSGNADKIKDPKIEVDRVFPEYSDSRLLAKEIWGVFDTDLACKQSISFALFYNWVKSISI